MLAKLPREKATALFLKDKLALFGNFRLLRLSPPQDKRFSRIFT
jgi:hypothetical protein